jgi:hypothetical protein
LPWTSFLRTGGPDSIALPPSLFFFERRWFRRIQISTLAISFKLNSQTSRSFTHTRWLK